MWVRTTAVYKEKRQGELGEWTKEHKVPILYEKEVSQEDFDNRPWADHEMDLRYYMSRYCKAGSDALVKESLEP